MLYDGNIHKGYLVIMTPLSTLFLDHYQEQAKLLHWHADQEQQLTLKKIAVVYQNRLEKQSQWFFTRLWGRRKFTATGIYLYGPVGRGKTVLMDIAASTLPSARKIRWHFTEFMQKIHALNANFAQKVDRKSNKSQPIEQTITYLKQHYDYLFLDELEVTEIADAMILGRLFKGLTEAGVIIFLTSNIPPERLYQGGLHYDRFYPFVSYIGSTFQVFKLNNDEKVDFRTVDKARSHGSLNLETLKQTFADIAEIEGYHPAQFTINQRVLKLPYATKTAVWLDFDEFGEKAYGSADYQLIAQTYRQVFLVNVPQFDKERRNPARRFITLVDCLYDNQVTLYLQAATTPEKLFSSDMEPPLPSGRTVSRLIEMS
ncbi:cell division protein ZapE [Candidatus Paracaedibacter symbiosus]|uniref:cell division protein ZapE n=1 Tax=Candidatus Paracaedibacter symbiosus TaxID=244582 RepID=UPI0005097484|nr:cell division protein ZapE [Candidatus Paracaedibacter symbiosus]